MNFCSGCKVELTDENGYRHKTGAAAGKFFNYCKPCAIAKSAKWRKDNPEKGVAISRSWTQRNPEKVKNRSAEQRRIFAERILKLKEGKPCLDCTGSFPPECMDFDHLRDKKFTISSAGAGRNWPSVLEEIAKCDLICANCHRIRTKKRLCPTNSNP